MPNSPLERPFFRTAATPRSEVNVMGKMLMHLSPSYKAYLWASTLTLLALLLWAGLIRLQSQVQVRGYLDVQPGVIQVFSPKEGVVSHIGVKLGQTVHRGERIFEVRPLIEAEPAHLKARMKTLSALKAALMQRIKGKQLRIKAYQGLLLEHYVTQSEVDALKQECMQLQQQLLEVQSQFQALKLSRPYWVDAPATGVVSQLNLAVGQRVSSSEVLIKLMPLAARWVAHLIVPMEALRFISPDKWVQLRYDAYPYRQFGGVRGQLVQTPLLVRKTKRSASNQAFYEVKVNVPEPYIQWQGSAAPLYQGMSLSAILTGEKQHLWEGVRHWH